MIISGRRQFVFVHNPKCGGSWFRNFLAGHHDHPEQFWDIRFSPFLGLDLDYAHLRTWEIAMHHPELIPFFRRARSVVFVRHPLRRFVSALLHHHRTYRPHLGIDRLPPAARRALLHAFVDRKLTPARILGDYRYVHFSPQRWFFMLGDEQVVRHLVPLDARLRPFETAFEALDLPVPEDRFDGERLVGDTELLRDGRIQAAAETLYAEDYVLLARKPTLAPLLLRKEVEEAPPPGGVRGGAPPFLTSPPQTG